MLAEQGRGGGGIESGGAELGENCGGARGEVSVDETIQLGAPLDVAGVEFVGGTLIRMHVAAIIPPACRLRDDRKLDLAGALLPAGNIAVGSESAVVEEVAVDT